MGRSITFGCTRLPTGKKGKLVKDDKGYYEIALGAFNVTSSRGEYYPFLDQVAAMFKPTGTIMRQLQKGIVIAEDDHPKPTPGMSEDDWIERVLYLDDNNKVEHIASVRIEDAKDENGKPIVLTIGRVKPEGPKSHLVEGVYENPDENLYHSIRTLAIPVFTLRGKEKHVTEIVTWDKVREGGVDNSDKYSTPSMEAMVNDFVIREEALRKLAYKASAGASMEAAVNAKRVLTNLGWQNLEVINPLNLILPEYLSQWED